MTDEQAVPDTASQRAKWPLLTIVGWLSTMVATLAAAVSAWASLQSIEEAKGTQLLERRVQACFDADRSATAQLTSVLLEIGEAAGAEALATYNGDDRYAWYDEIDFYPDHPVWELPCEEGEAANVCEARKQRAAQHYAERLSLSENVVALRGELAFEAARTFNLIGPPALASAERELAGKLRELRTDGQLMLQDERLTLVQQTVDAHARFVAACRASIAEYSNE